MSIEGLNIEDGMVMGYVSTNLVGSRVEFEICTVEEWEESTPEEAEEMAQQAMFNWINWGY